MSKFEIKHRVPKEEYVGQWNGQAKDLFKSLGFTQMWDVVDSETGEIVGGASTKERAQDVANRIK